MTCLTPSQKAILCGTLLSGSTVREVGENTAQLIQTGKDVEWLEWKGKQLEPFVSSMVKGPQGIRLMSKCCSEILPYRSFYTNEGRRRVGTVVHECADDPLFLVTWFTESGFFRNLDAFFSLKRSFLAHDHRLLKRLLKGWGLDKAEFISEAGRPLVRISKQRHCVVEHFREHAPSFLNSRAGFDVDPEDLDPGPEPKRLTTEKATSLLACGISLKEMAELYDVSYTTCWRRTKDACEPPEQITIPEATDLLADIDHEAWATRDASQQEEDITHALTILRKTPFPFPESLSETEMAEEFSRLQEKYLSVDDNKEVRPDSMIGLKLCRPYFRNRYKARHSERNLSCYEGWFTEVELRRALKFQMSYGSPLIPYRIRRALQANLRTPTLFKPAQAKFICDYYGKEGGVYWDPCAGYGGRLLGALASGMRYIGTDVDPETVQGNLRLSQDLGLEDNTTVIECPAESFTPGVDLDLVFTSPPYFNREVYSKESNQSSQKYGSIERWLQGFLCPVFRTAYDHLKPSCLLVINIADLNSTSDTRQTIPLVQHTIDAAINTGFTHHETLKMPLSNLSPRDHEPILVFKKP